MKSFTNDIRDFKDVARQRAAQAARSLALEIHAQVVARSPVDTGRFRANNQVRCNALPTGVLAATDKDGAATLRRGRQAVADYALGDTVFLANNLPYAYVLEFGRGAAGGAYGLAGQAGQGGQAGQAGQGEPGSAQAPQGVYRISVQHVLSRAGEVARAGMRDTGRDSVPAAQPFAQPDAQPDAGERA